MKDFDSTVDTLANSNFVSRNTVLSMFVNYINETGDPFALRDLSYGDMDSIIKEELATPDWRVRHGTVRT